MKKLTSLFAAAMLVASMGLLSSCDAAEKLCGPCGDVYAGDAFISGNAQIDGVFKAVGTFGNATAKIDASFRSELEGLAEVFGVEGAAEMSIEDLVAEVKGEINAEINANVSGSLKVKFVEPKCEAAVSVAVEAQAECEASAGCEISAECESGELAVSCEGSCSGGCSGSCSGSCTVEASAACSGECTGSCELSAAATCEGTCHGTCSGECSLTNAQGECEGECDGECEGTCELEAGGSCSGTCHGTCTAEIEGECEGSCEGSCDAECSGSCQGTAEPPSCSAEGECEASADCSASASAQASASVECTPPSLEIDFEFAAGVDATAQAEFIAKMSELRIRMVAIIQGMFQLRALIDMDYAAEIGIDSPVVAIQGAVQGLLDMNIEDLDIPAGRLPCVIPALEDSIDILGSAGTDLLVTLQGQVEIVGVLNIL